MAVLVFYDCLLPSSSMKSHHPSITTFNTIRWREQVLAHKMEAAANACAMSELKQDHAKQVCFILIGMLLCPLPVHLSHQSRTNSLTHPLVHSLPDSPTHTHTRTHTHAHTRTHTHTHALTRPFHRYRCNHFKLSSRRKQERYAPVPLCCRNQGSTFCRALG